MKFFISLIFIFNFQTSIASTCTYYFEKNSPISYEDYVTLNYIYKKVVVSDFKNRTWTFDVGGSAGSYYFSNNKTILKRLYQFGKSHKVYLIITDNPHRYPRSVIVEFNLITQRTKTLYELPYEMNPTFIYSPYKSDYLIIEGFHTNFKAHQITTLEHSVYIVMNNDNSFNFPISYIQYGHNPNARAAVRRTHNFIPAVEYIEYDNKRLNDGKILWHKSGQYYLTLNSGYLRLYEVNLIAKKPVLLAEVDLSLDELPDLIKEKFGYIKIKYSKK